MNLKNKLSILSNVSSSQLVLEPYPHIIIENALDKDIFNELQDNFPNDETIVDGRDLQDTWYDYPACKVLEDDKIHATWKTFFRHHTSKEFFDELVEVVGDSILALNPTLEDKIGTSIDKFRVSMRPGGRSDTLAPGADISMECQFYVNYSQKVRTVRGPHIDRPSELFAALLYFRQDGDSSIGSDLNVCRATSNLYPSSSSVKISELPAEIDSELITVVSTAPYKENTLVLFLNSPKSIHAVSQRSPTNLTRRHINFCCDVPFDLFELELPLKLKIKDKLSSIPLGWRLSKYIK
ncbi:hypothetical protein [Neptunomonas sp.]|uniref:hypothetical protein n=1 Tax=Neptunomonas sp. TaxID=1971898 RepID=UPI0025EDDAAD|nr:hypothetical protein [Neptunomonas sp.]